MIRNTTKVAGNLVLLMLAILYGPFAPGIISAQSATAGSAATMADKKSSTPNMSDAEKIALAMSAGPAEIAKNATIADMSTMKQLRAGSNGWVCYAAADQPMCLDKQWQAWVKALMSKSEPRIEGTGIAYMLRGDNGASNIDPYATKPTADNAWVVSPAHLMVLFQDQKMLDSYPTDPMNGGPWVMWKGTPYAHVMVPVSPTKMPTMAPK
jgi:hypothetical protein